MGFDTDLQGPNVWALSFLGPWFSPCQRHVGAHIDASLHCWHNMLSFKLLVLSTLNSAPQHRTVACGSAFLCSSIDGLMCIVLEAFQDFIVLYRSC